MILSHHWKFIFIKTMKTAGTSIEIALSRLCGVDDVITPISPEDETYRRDLGVFPRNYEFEPTDSRGRDLPALRTSNSKFYNHMGAAEIKREVGDEVWNSYFKFCVERNPWDRVLSMYHWENRNQTQWTTFSAFLRSQRAHLLHRRGWGLYTIEDAVVVDDVLRYEDLATELERVRSQLGMPDELELPRAKGEYRADRRPYSEVMSATEIEEIRRKFADEIALMAY